MDRLVVMNAEAPLKTLMTTDEFLAWSETIVGDERYELVRGRPVKLQSEKVSHAETKLSAVIALRDALRNAGLDRRAFVDGVSVRIDDYNVRERDAVVNCGTYDRDAVFLSNPVLVVEVVSPSSERRDVGRKLLDYFAVPSILHYLIVYADEQRVIHHHRSSAGGGIGTAILGRGISIDPTPPGFAVAVDDLLGEEARATADPPP